MYSGFKKCIVSFKRQKKTLHKSRGATAGNCPVVCIFIRSPGMNIVLRPLGCVVVAAPTLRTTFCCSTFCLREKLFLA